MDVVGVCLSIAAVTVLLDEAIPRAGLLAVAMALASAAVLAVHRGLFPGIAMAIAAFTAATSIAVVVAPLAPRALRLARGIATVVAVIAAVAGALHV